MGADSSTVLAEELPSAGNCGSRGSRRVPAGPGRGSPAARCAVRASPSGAGRSGRALWRPEPRNVLTPQRLICKATCLEPCHHTVAAQQTRVSLRCFGVLLSTSLVMVAKPD